MIKQKMINELENRFAEMDTTKENVQWFFDRLMEIVTDDSFAEEFVYGNIHFDSLSGFDTERNIRRDYVAYNCFTAEQEAEINNAIGDAIEDLCDGEEIAYDMMRNQYAWIGR